MKRVISLAIAAIMVVTMSVSVFAEDVQVSGEIGTPPSTTNQVYSVDMPTTVKFYVHADSFNGSVTGSDYDVWNTPSNVNVTNPNVIKNTNTLNTNYKIAMSRWEPEATSDAATVANDLDLYFTGALAYNFTASGGADLTGDLGVANPITNSVFYSNSLVPYVNPGDEWEYGFTGTYDDGSGAQFGSGTFYAPKYTMTLTFALA